MPLNEKAQIRIHGVNFDFMVPLGEGTPALTAGGAQYEEGKRPKADAVTLFTGNALLKMDVPVLFNVWQQAQQHPENKQIDVWPQVQQVLNLCWGSDRSDPPDFTVSGPVPYSGRRWQMEFPEWGVSNKHDDGRLLRQYLILHLIEFNDASSIDPHKKAGPLETAGIGNGTKAARAITITSPESLAEIAARVYNNPSLGIALGRYNNIRDIRRKLPAGFEVLVPSKGELEAEIGSVGAKQRA